MKSLALAVSALVFAAVLPFTSAGAASLRVTADSLRSGDAVIGVANGCGIRRHYSYRLRRCVWN
jgi:hypothetical protein